MMADVQPYRMTKDCGVEWLGKVPEHWKIVPALAVYRPRQVRNIGLTEKTVLSLSYGRIIVKPLERLRGLVPESFETYQIVDPGNIIVRTTDLQNDQMSLRVGHARSRGIITAAYMCLETTPLVSNEFGYQYLNAYDLLKIIYGFGSGLRQNLDFGDIKRMPVLLPPRQEQTAIVRFLDHADRWIRRYIRAKQKLIKLLEEQKQAIIHRTVTRGLDPNARLKRSGVEWLGDVPEHWGVRRVHAALRERKQTGRPDLPILVVSIASGVTRGEEIDEHGRPKRFIVDRALYKVARKGDIAYNMMRMWQGAVGVAPMDGLISPAYVVAEPHQGVNAAYFALLFRTDACKGEVVSRSRGIVDDRNRLYWDAFKDICVPFPPSAEQDAIVRWIAAQTSDIESSIERVLREVALLREYRTRQIADVVTGKLDVREAAARLPEEAEELEPLDEAAAEADDDVAAADNADEVTEEAEA